MTKTLTEQWREGTLPQGNYYVNAKNIYNGDLYKGEIDHFNGEAHWFRFAGVEEVLEPVPSYDEYKRLHEQLAIATNALKEYAEIETHDWVDSQAVAKRALKEMEGVK